MKTVVFHLQAKTCEKDILKLKKEILSIKVGGININEMTDLSVKSLQEFLRKLELTDSQKMIAEMILKEIVMEL